jgi:hypothetical protein
MPVCHHPIGHPHFPYSVEMLTGNIHINGPVPTACVHKSSYSLLPCSGRLVRLVQVASDGAVAEHDLDRLDGGNGGVQRRCRDIQCGDVVALGGRGEELGEGDRGFCCLSRYCELLFVWREDNPAQVFGEAFSFLCRDPGVSGGTGWCFVGGIVPTSASSCHPVQQLHWGERCLLQIWLKLARSSYSINDSNKVWC